jgi:hypothetical protein
LFWAAATALGIAALSKATSGHGKRVFISYDHDDNRNYRSLLSAWDANSDFEFTFDDRSPAQKINSEDVGVVRSALTRRMKEAEYLLVIVGEYTADSDWVDWEIRRAMESDVNLRLAAVKVSKRHRVPKALRGTGVAISDGFTRDGVVDALNRAGPSRK